MKQSAFSISNSWHTLRWMLLTNKRQLSVMAVGMAIGTFIVGEYIVGRSYISINGTTQHGALSVTLHFLFGLAYALWMLYGASRMFAFTKTKQSAITYMMHPASDAEMFAARLAYVSVAWAAVGGIGMLVGDLARWLLDTLLGGGAPMAIVQMWRTMCIVSDSISQAGAPGIVAKMSVVSLLYSLWIYTLYILGGAVLRRHRILFTTIAVTMMHISVAEHITEASHMSALGIAVLLGILCMANVAAAYALFRRMQVINNKWLNI